MPVRNALLHPLLGILVAFVPAEAMRAGESLPLDTDRLGEWTERRIDGQTRYGIDRTERPPAIRADTLGGASALVLERRIDLHRTPHLQWWWKTRRFYRGLDERRLDEMDFPLRISASLSTGFGFWNVWTLSYVVAGELAVGDAFAHPNNDRTMMVVIANARAAPNAWHRQKVNLRADFARHLGLDVDHVDALSILVDNDSAGQATTTWVRGLELSPR